MRAYARPTRACLSVVLILGLAIAYGWVQPLLSQPGAASDPNQTQRQPAAPASGYLESHKGVQQPLEILGGPISSFGAPAFRGRPVGPAGLQASG